MQNSMQGQLFPSQYSKVFLEVKNESALAVSELDYLKESNLIDLAPIESWTACGTNVQLSYSTHGIFRYFGKFPPPIATHLIQEYSVKGQMVCDLMCGSGTTGVEALLLGRDCILNDVSPLSCLLSKVKTQRIEGESLIEAADRISRRYLYGDINLADFNPIGIKNIEHWFLPETILSLKKIRALIEEEKSEIKDFLYVAFISIIRKVSRATSQQGRLFLDVNSAIKDAYPDFMKKVQNYGKAVSSLPSRNNGIQIFSSDLREQMPSRLNKTAQLAILHPPYFNSYKYSSVNSLELAWLGYDHADIRKSEVKEFFKVGKPQNVDTYVEDMRKVIDNMIPILKDDSHLAVMIGDTVMKDQHIPVTRMLLDSIDKKVLQLCKIAIRIPKFTEASWVTSQRRGAEHVGIKQYDYILIFRRNQHE